MRHLSVCSALLVVLTLEACVTTVLAPGADKVRMTSSPADVAGCKALGNLEGSSDAINYQNIVRNETVGLGGNVAFLTTGSGIAYLCP
jgi:hypothetical protein